MGRKEFIINKVIINGRPVKRIIVDEHVDKHRDITDDIIIDLVRLLDGVYQLPEEIKPPFEYYTTLLILNEKQYRLVWLLEENELYIGIITTYRDNRSK
ncbi:MAG: hypothetical protein A2381_05460 [Bdellovibrionales bacterium RIFOXYB1_FULL_37_110]|nr:MAG: hypothetical protein A2181_03125 [Bdellovibrionales bacterium RIFOXYA1_FULL_38_20]OFZ46626.1 MAG: hypothetical protein A2417_14400 [Bdellovibrionales bacterium RIFOXYC1_FULL_37_79]OFZ57368.1 MAG: hypothetical protein A2381_05460 [Bdellovibrionales bacterium RIFOXYB1_FULL_37_110]OFZ62536.1 MAG: hypothetical protein A2577_08305 [Bdellovibrionales bacterium RIFOXYD1_FULL_36_51]